MSGKSQVSVTPNKSRWCSEIKSEIKFTLLKMLLVLQNPTFRLRKIFVAVQKDCEVTSLNLHPLVMAQQLGVAQQLPQLSEMRRCRWAPTKRQQQKFHWIE